MCLLFFLLLYGVVRFFINTYLCSFCGCVLFFFVLLVFCVGCVMCVLFCVCLLCFVFVFLVVVCFFFVVDCSCVLCCCCFFVFVCCFYVCCVFLSLRPPCRYPWHHFGANLQKKMLSGGGSNETNANPKRTHLDPPKSAFGTYGLVLERFLLIFGTCTNHYSSRIWVAQESG